MPDAQTKGTGAYQKAEEVFAVIHAVGASMRMLHWDSAVMMPESAAPVRGEQMATLGQINHERMTDPRLCELLDEAEFKSSELDDFQRANLSEMRRQWQHANACDVKLVREMAIATSESEVAWRQARKNNDFKALAPYLRHVLNLVREEAQAKATALNLAPYDALMDGYDPGTRMAEVDEVFARLGAFLPDFRAQAMEYQAKQVEYQPLTESYAIAKQQKLGETLSRRLGFTGRIDISTHPFCGGTPGDVRITTRYNERDFMDALQGVLHETGHALYEQNLPGAWRLQPVGEARGMSTHESQSLLVEMQLCRSREFLQFATPLIKDMLGTEEAGINAENLYRVGTQVKPGLIRVRADEVCYPSHVIMRYELEKALVDGSLQVDDLPGAWNEAMQEKLGITPPNDADGCLQDIHWPSGSFGYFPTYTIGAIMAAQWFAAIRRDIPDVLEQVKNGDFAAFTHWLETHVHRHGSRYSRQELLKKATGEELNVEIYQQHLQERYLN